MRAFALTEHQWCGRSGKASQVILWLLHVPQFKPCKEFQGDQGMKVIIEGLNRVVQIEMDRLRSRCRYLG